MIRSKATVTSTFPMLSYSLVHNKGIPLHYHLPLPLSRSPSRSHEHPPIARPRAGNPHSRIFSGRREQPLPTNMADPTADKKLPVDESGSVDEKPGTETVERQDSDSASPRTQTRLQAPEFIRNLSPEERERLEKRLKRKIDARLLPAVIVMYILNYIDRYVLFPACHCCDVWRWC